MAAVRGAGAMLAPVAGSAITGRMGFAAGTTVWATFIGAYWAYLSTPEALLGSGFAGGRMLRGLLRGMGLAGGGAAGGGGKSGGKAGGGPPGVLAGLYNRLSGSRDKK